MSKALGFSKDQFKVDLSTATYGIAANPEQLFDFKYELLTRPECETMYDYMHLIPYITLVNKETGQLFVYSRGKQGGENRLHGKCSIGLGGHMEDVVTGTYSIKDAIVDTIAKELEEEVGLKPTIQRAQQYLSNLNTKNFSLLLDQTNDVGKVHLGIAMFVTIDPALLGAVEHGVIERGRWISVEEINRMRDTNELDLENWSRIVMDVVNAYLAENATKLEA